MTSLDGVCDQCPALQNPKIAKTAVISDPGATAGNHLSLRLPPSYRDCAPDSSQYSINMGFDCWQPGKHSIVK